MKKGLLGVIVGAVVYFAWGAVSWTLLPWHNATIKTLPQETLITDTMKTVIKEPGFYLFPGNKELPSPTQPDGAKAWEERYRAGPVGAVVFSPTGREPMGGAVFLKQFVSGLVIAGVLMLVYSGRREGVLRRVTLAAAVGLAAGVATHFQHLIWFSFPAGYTVVGILDLVAGFALMGAAMAKLVPEV